MKTFMAFVVFAFIASALGTPAIDANENVIPAINRNKFEEGFLRKLKTKCSQRDNHSCMMLKLIIFMNRTFKKTAIEINENIDITQNRDIAEIHDDLDPDYDILLGRSLNSDDETLGLIVAEKLWKFVKSRMLRYKFSDNADLTLQMEPKGNLKFGVSISPINAIEEGRGRMKNMAPIMMMMAAKAGIVGALLLKGLFVLAGKALIISKIALLLSVIIALKKLLSQKKHVVEVPHHDSYSSGWARALDGFIEGIADVPAQLMNQDAQELAYAAQQPVKSNKTE